MAAKSLFQKNYPKFESFAREICKIHGIKIIKKDHEQDHALGLFYVDKQKPILQVPTYINEESFLIFAHEFGHAMQYLAKDENLCGAFYQKEIVTEIFHKWLSGGKEYPPEIIAEVKQRLKEIELGAEEKMIEYNRIFKLGISEKILWKMAYAYIYQIEYMFQYRTGDLQIYHLKRSILSKMPNNKKAKNFVLIDSSPSIIYLLKQEHDKIIKK